jgi:hypothetical protein
MFDAMGGISLGVVWRPNLFVRTSGNGEEKSYIDVCSWYVYILRPRTAHHRTYSLAACLRRSVGPSRWGE